MDGEQKERFINSGEFYRYLTSEDSEKHPKYILDKTKWENGDLVLNGEHLIFSTRPKYGGEQNSSLRIAKVKKNESGAKVVLTPTSWDLIESGLGGHLEKNHFHTKTVAFDIYTGQKYTGVRDLSYMSPELENKARRLVVQYVTDQNEKGNIPEKYTSGIKWLTENLDKAPDDRLETLSKRSGLDGSKEFPKIRPRFIINSLLWSEKGTLGLSEDCLVYRDEKGKEVNVQIISRSDDTSFLTKSAWNILRTPTTSDSVDIQLSSRAFGNVHNYSQAELIKGKWVVTMRGTNIDTTTLIAAKNYIKAAAEREISSGSIKEKEVLDAIDVLAEYKDNTIKQSGYAANYGTLCALKEEIDSKEQRSKPLNLIDKVYGGLESERGVSRVEIENSDLEGYIKNLSFPYGATINKLSINTESESGKIQGLIHVPIPFVGGDIRFSLELSGKESEGLIVKKGSYDASSGALRSRLYEVEKQLSALNGLVIGTLNREAAVRGFKINSISIDKEGKIIFSAVQLK